MESNEDIESVKGHTVRFFKWNQLLTAIVLRLFPGCGVVFFHTKITTFQSSGVYHSTDDYMAFLINASHFFMLPTTAKWILRKQLENMKFSRDTKEIVMKDICDYIFGYFKLEPDIFRLAKRLPVIVSDIYLTRQKGEEDLGHVGKRRKVSYMCSFTDIDAALKKYIRSSQFFNFPWEDVLTRNKGLLRICPVVKEKNYRSKTNVSLCVICLEGYEKGEKLMVGPCSHIFHRACLLKWLPGSCPICRGCLTKEFSM